MRTSASEQLHKGKEKAGTRCWVWRGTAVTCLNNVSSCTSHLGDDSLVCATPSIQQAAFPYIGSTNQGYLQLHSSNAGHCLFAASDRCNVDADVWKRHLGF